MTEPFRRAGLSRAAFVTTASAALALPRAASADPAAIAIKMAGVPEDSATTVLYAVHSGMFASLGLDVDMQPQHNGPSVMSGVVGGSYQFGKSSTTPLLAAFARGLPFTIVMPAGIYDARAPIAALLVRRDAAIAKASDLNGKLIAVGALNDIHSLATMAWLDRNGGDSSTVKFVEIPIAEIPVAIEQGRVTAGSVNEPVLSDALANPAIRSFARNFDGIAPRFMYTAWFTTTTYAAANRAEVQRLAAALRKAAVYVNAHPAQTVDLIATFTGLDPARVQKMTRVEQGTALDGSLLQPVVDAMLKYKQLAHPIDDRAILFTG